MPRKKKVSKLTKKSEAMKLLRAKLENGELTGREDPRSVWESEALFREHKLAHFRTRYTKLRKELLDLNGDDESDVEAMNRKCSHESKPFVKKRRIIPTVPASIDVDEEEEGYDMEEGAGMELTAGAWTFRPLHLMSVLTEPRTMTRRISVAIVLPSGTAAGDFSVRVVDGRDYLELTVNWPPPLIDISVLHKKWLSSTGDDRIESYHPKFGGFEAALQQLRKRSSDTIESAARIPLPFSVKTHIYAKYNLGWKDSSVKLVYVDLREVVEEYSVLNDNESFELI